MPWSMNPTVVVPVAALAVMIAASTARLALGGVRFVLRLAVWASAALLVAALLFPRASELIAR